MKSLGGVSVFHIDNTLKTKPVSGVECHFRDLDPLFGLLKVYLELPKIALKITMTCTE